ncbi:transposase [Streptomyces galilaeus]
MRGPEASGQGSNKACPSPYSPEFREEAVQLALKSSEPVAHVARDLNVNPGPLPVPATTADVPE